MTIMKRALLILTAIILCASPSIANAAKKQSISFKKSAITMTVGSTKKLKVLVKPAKAASRIKFSSSNKKVATISKKGKVKAKKKGTTKITAKVSAKLKARCTITVKKKNQKNTANSDNSTKTSVTQNPFITTPVSNKVYHSKRAVLVGSCVVCSLNDKMFLFNGSTVTESVGGGTIGNKCVYGDNIYYVNETNYSIYSMNINTLSRNAIMTFESSVSDFAILNDVIYACNKKKTTLMTASVNGGNVQTISMDSGNTLISEYNAIADTRESDDICDGWSYYNSNNSIWRKKDGLSERVVSSSSNSSKFFSDVNSQKLLFYSSDYVNGKYVYSHWISNTDGTNAIKIVNYSDSVYQTFPNTTTTTTTTGSQSGQTSTSTAHTCGLCGGDGLITCTVCHGTKGHYITMLGSQVWQGCATCGQTGNMVCTDCGGSGQIK